MKKIDMSEFAVLRRLEQADQLREISLSLMKAKRSSGVSGSKGENHPRKNEQSSKVEQIEHFELTEQIKLPNVEQD